jgi:hypothetical protein
MVKRTGKQKLSVAQQSLALAQAFPSHRPKMKNGKMILVVPIEPSQVSDTYTMRLEYSLGSRPKITVQSPDLKRSEGKRLPHTFESDELCLHYEEEFSGQDLIAKTIVPWISEWLVHYELWLITGKWLGGGHGNENGESRKE